MQYVPVRIRTLRPDNIVNFDVYVQLGQRYVHYIRNSSPFEEERLSRLKEKKVKKLYIRLEEEPQYLAYLSSGLDDLNNKEVTLEKRSEFAKDALITEAENIERSFETEKGYHRTEEHMQKVIDFLTSDKGALKSILASSGVSFDNFQHCANVASLALGLATRVGVADNKEHLAMGLAALLHDIGIPKLGLDPNALKSSFTEEQTKTYKRHPGIAVEVLAGKPYITPKILRLISDHEEIGMGKGFPERKYLPKLPLSSQVLNLCNDFDRFSIEKGLAPLEAFSPFVDERGELFDMNHVAQL